MISNKRWMMGVSAFVFCLFLITPIIQAETPYDITECHSGKVKILHSTEESRTFSAEGLGIVMSNHENKVFHNFTIQIFAIGQVMPGKSTEKGYIKLMDPNGDIIMMEFARVDTERVSKILYGTGRWKGITGGAKSEHRIVIGRIPPDAAAACSRSTGTFELPKK